MRVRLQRLWQDTHRLDTLQSNRRLHAQRVLYFGKRVRMLHEIPDLGFGCVSNDSGLVGHVRRWFSFCLELPIYVDLDALNLYSSLCGFTVDVVAIARGQCQEQQFSSISARAEPRGIWRNDDGMSITVRRQGHEMFAVAVLYSSTNLHNAPRLVTATLLASQPEISILT
jgi:hypothetical protein